MTAENTIQFPTAQSSEKEKTWWFEENGKFWVPAESGHWVSLEEKAFSHWLQTFQKFTALKIDNSPITAVEKEILHTKTERRVSYAGPLAGYKQGLQKFDDTQILVTRSPELIEPTPGRFDTITQYLTGLLQTHPNEIEPQLNYFLGWHQHALQSLYRGKPSKGLSLVFAGAAGCGKTLLKDLIQITFGRRECKPYPYMTGRTNFNKDLIEAPLWSIDDEAASTRPEDRVKFGAALKIAVANTEIRSEAKHANAGSLNSFRRVLICVNDEPDRLLVLPALDDDIQDKIMILHCTRGPDIMPTQTEDEKEAFWEALVAELPHYIHWLLNEFTLERSMSGRFGVGHYHNPTIFEQLAEISPERETERVIQKGIFGKHPTTESTEWSTVDEILDMLINDDSGLTAREKDRLPGPAWIGRRLAKVATRNPKHYLHKRSAKSNLWKIWNLNAEPEKEEKEQEEIEE